MLKTIDLINKIGEEYAPMLKQVNIPDFYKCIAVFAGLDISDIPDEVIEEYLTHWATHKKYIFDFLGEKIKIDMPIKYIDEDRDFKGKIDNLASKYPTYFFWLNGIERAKKNILDRNDLDWGMTHAIYSCFPNYKYQNETITHFFKKKLNAPDNLITELASVWENLEIESNFTISIDPVDIMLASKNPYGWTSCYNICNGDYADGCLAGVLDKGTIITYIWDEEGKYSLNEKYSFKNIRFKRMRMTIGINENFNVIHFNTIYPGKNHLSENFKKLLRTKVEDYFAEKLKVESSWKKNDSINLCAYRKFDNYGYREYDSDNIYVLNNKDNKEYKDIIVYDTEITCPCGCGETYVGSYDKDEEEWEHFTTGHRNEAWIHHESIWCEYADEYVFCDTEDCQNCLVYNRANAACNINGSFCERSEDAEYCGFFDPDCDNIVYSNKNLCEDCLIYQNNIKQQKKKKEDK